MNAEALRLLDLSPFSHPDSASPPGLLALLTLKDSNCSLIRRYEYVPGIAQNALGASAHVKALPLSPF